MPTQTALLGGRTPCPPTRREARPSAKRAFLGIVALTTTLLASTAYAASLNIVPAAPAVAARSYVMLDAQTLRVLAEGDSHLPLPPASLTKIMTSYVAAAELAAGRIALEDEVPISVNAWRTGGSRMFVREGTKVALADLLRGIIIQSGNDASVAVAEYIGGAEDSFADMMNQHAAEIGLTNSTFRNATGLPDDEHLSSAYDLALLSRELIRRYPDHYAIYAEKSFSYADIEQSNRNQLLWLDDSVDGVKTGLTDAAGFCLVASADRTGMRLITAVMGTDSADIRTRETQKLLSWGFRYFETKQILSEGEVLATPEVWYGEEETVELGAAELHATFPRGRLGDMETVLDLPEVLEAPIEAGAEVGELRLVLDGETVATAPLLARTSVPEAGVFSRAWDSIYLFFRDLIG